MTVGANPCWDVVIVGSGPAGSAAAIQLCERDRSLAARTLLLDRAQFPRHKLCGGGVVQRADELLGFLGVRVNVPSLPIHAVKFEHPGGTTIRRGLDLFRIVRREEFDDALVQAARARGVQTRAGEAVTALRREADCVSIRTTAGQYRARVVVGADGAKSLVRRALVGAAAGQRFIALEVLTPEDPSTSVEFTEHTAVFDFRAVADGLRGYAWDFPSFKAGAALMNRGIGGVTWPRDRSLKHTLTGRLSERGVSFPNDDLEGAAVPLYNPNTSQSAERVVLAGDAVGVDPMMGEGISVAIGTGMIAAHAVVDGFKSGDLSFADYGRRIASSSIGWSLRRNWMAAGLFYRRLRDGDGSSFPESGFQ